MGGLLTKSSHFRIRGAVYGLGERVWERPKALSGCMSNGIGCRL